MQIRNDHVTGFVVGLGAAAVGFYLYRKNQPQVDAFLRQQGINLPSSCGMDPDALSIEELVAEKERLEDLIAEREHAASQEAAAEPAKPEPEEAPRKRGRPAAKR